MSIFLSIYKKLKIIIRVHGRYRQAFFILLSLLIGGSILIYLLERGVNEQFATPGDGLWWAIVTITTVGYGDKYPVTAAGRLVALIVMFGGIGSFGYIAGSLLEDLIKREQGKMAINCENHYVICSYSFKADNIIKEIKAELKDCKIVLIADREENPLSGTGGVSFVRGDSTKEAVLQKANVAKAKTCIVLADNKMDEYMADAHSVLTTLAIQHLNPSCKIIAESLNPENVDHFRRAGADEIISTGDISSKLIVRSSLYPGVTNLFHELMTNNFGNEIYSGVVPDYLINYEFEKAITKFRESQAILIGVYQDGRFIANPPANTLLKKDDLLIYIAPNKVI